MQAKPTFNFEISLSVLNHLGRQLYRSFATVLGEAISNAWDADATNVWIDVDENRGGFWIKDDGSGMNADGFQNKFLKVGYSKRKLQKRSPNRKRPFIGRKGIGKLALLSCADRISVISKTKGEKYVGGTIDNRALDKAITEDLTPQDYPLSVVNMRAFEKHTVRHTQGTIIRFERLKDGFKRSFEFLQETIALYFRFSLIDKSFRIHLNGEEITHRHLRKLNSKTQFLWRIGKQDDPYIEEVLSTFAKKKSEHETKVIKIGSASGFIASVQLPRDLKILTIDERVGVDLFVNGRLRERDILKHIPTARIVENYLYGQVHFNTLDDATDRFTSSREGIVAEDPKFESLLEKLRAAILGIVEDWDEWRIKHRNEGDADNKRISKPQRASIGLYNAVTLGFEPPKGSAGAGKVEKWVDGLSADAAFNFESYAECFVSENLIRKYITDKPIELSDEARAHAKKWRGKETDSMNRGNISIQIRKDLGDLSYLSMDDLANLVDKPQDKTKEAALSRDASEFKPIRDAVAHTALITDPAKAKLKTVRENIKARVKKLMSQVKRTANRRSRE